MLECLNVEVSDRVPQLVCSVCCKFLQQARKFRDMVVASQKALRDAVQKSDEKNFDVKTKLNAVEVEFDYVKDDPDHVKKDTNYVEQDEKQENEIAFDRTSSVDEYDDGTPDDDGMEDDRGSNELFDNTDNKTSKNVKAQELSTRDLKLMEKLTDAKLNLKIRENLSNILQNSTVIPFVTAKRSEKLECIYCDDAFSRFAELRNHVETEHNEDCSFKVQALKLLNLKRDPDLIVCADVSCIKCRLCDERFATVDNLVQHLINIHNEAYHNISRDPPHNILCFDMSLDHLTCLDCLKTFTHMKGLLVHMNRHYGSYLCYECGSRFLHETSYKIHMNVSLHYRGRPRLLS